MHDTASCDDWTLPPLRHRALRCILSQTVGPIRSRCQRQRPQSGAYTTSQLNLSRSLTSNIPKRLHAPSILDINIPSTLPVPLKALTLSRKVDESKPLPATRVERRVTRPKPPSPSPFPAPPPARKPRGSVITHAAAGDLPVATLPLPPAARFHGHSIVRHFSAQPETVVLVHRNHCSIDHPAGVSNKRYLH